jgi:hypothetical protein
MSEIGLNCAESCSRGGRSLRRPIEKPSGSGTGGRSTSSRPALHVQCTRTLALLSGDSDPFVRCWHDAPQRGEGPIVCVSRVSELEAAAAFSTTSMHTTESSLRCMLMLHPDLMQDDVQLLSGAAHSCRSRCTSMDFGIDSTLRRFLKANDAGEVASARHGACHHLATHGAAKCLQCSTGLTGGVCISSTSL